MTAFFSNRILRHGLLALGLAGLTATAQASPGFMAGPGMHAHSAERHGPMQQRQSQRLDALKTKLQLSTAQEGAWNSFTAALKAGPSTRPDPVQLRQDMAQLSTPERLERMKAWRAQRQAAMNSAMDQRSQATLTFYATLSAEQKKMFDDETLHLMARGSRQHGRG